MHHAHPHETIEDAIDRQIADNDRQIARNRETLNPAINMDCATTILAIAALLACWLIA